MGCLVVYLQRIGIARSTFEKGVMILGEKIKRNKRVKFVQPRLSFPENRVCKFVKYSGSSVDILIYDLGISFVPIVQAIPFEFEVVWFSLDKIRLIGLAHLTTNTFRFLRVS